MLKYSTENVLETLILFSIFKVSLFQSQYHRKSLTYGLVIFQDIPFLKLQNHPLGTVTGIIVDLKLI